MIKELRNKYKDQYGKELGYNSPEFNKIDLDTLVLADLIMSLLEEVKGLREDLKAKPIEEVKKVEEKKPVTPKK